MTITSQTIITARPEQHPRVQILPEPSHMIKLPLGFIYCTRRIAFTLDKSANNVILLVLIKRYGSSIFS